jgi:hypothetical protein
MSDGLVATISVLSLVMAAWCLFTAQRDRAIGRAHLVGLAVVELVVLVQVTLAAVRAAGASVSSMATFVGYLIAAALLLPAAAGLAHLEPTRWGAVITGVAALILPVLMLRLQQVWSG